jgi:hypothetical protein
LPKSRNRIRPMLILVFCDRTYAGLYLDNGSEYLEPLQISRITTQEPAETLQFLCYSGDRALLAPRTLHFGGGKITSTTKPTAPGCIPDYEPFPFRQRKKRRKIGPFSKRLSFAMLDFRTQEGRYARDICDGIAADLGGAPNAAQQLLCQMFALKVLRVQLLVQKILSGETVNLHTENYCLAWMNSARRDLESLNVLTVLPCLQSPLDFDFREMSDEQLEQALRLLEQLMPAAAP